MPLAIIQALIFKNKQTKNYKSPHNIQSIVQYNQFVKWNNTLPVNKKFLLLLHVHITDIMADLSPTMVSIITERFATLPLFQKKEGQNKWTGMLPVWIDGAGRVRRKCLGLYCSRDGEMKRENVLFVTSHSEACLSGLTSAHATQSCHGNCRLRRRKCKTEDMN